HLAAVALAMSRARLGAVGEPSDWLVASSHGAVTVRASWGTELVAIPIRELLARQASAKPDADLARELTSRACGVEVAPEEVLKATAVYRALEGLVAEHHLWALSVRCFDLVTGPRVSGCLALSRLCDEGIPAGCEGDVPSALALLWLHLLTGDLPWMANPARVSPARSEIVLAHCTVPRNAVRSSDLNTHFESGLGVAIQGELAPGPVTLVRLGGSRLEELWTCEGELVTAAREESLCRTQARIRTDPAALDALLERPLGNHVVLVPGHRERLLRASRRMILHTDER
ncbi:MAG: fucose isomerase, partial [Deltaproteobacteria bacterium]|nr:fucose isomerase [Deltaproteobacteria bacterium]